MNRGRNTGTAALANLLGALLVGLLVVACGGDEAGSEPAAESASSAKSMSGESGMSEAKGGEIGGATGPIAAIGEFIASQNIDKSRPSWKTSLARPPQVEFDDKSYFWDLQTNVGPIAIKLMPDVAPMHVSSTIYLTELGFFDGLKFHRVIAGFMAQGGDPLGNGRGSPGYKYEGEFDASVRHDRPYLLSMANAGPGTDGSQFFITFKKTPHLDGKHTIFGEVTEGVETVKELERWRARGSEHINDPLLIEKATIRVE